MDQLVLQARPFCTGLHMAWALNTESDNDLYQKVLACETRDQYVVAICKGDETVGHVPKYISMFYSLFIVGLCIVKFWEDGDI